MTTATALDRYPMPACAQTLGWSLIKADVATGRVKIAFDAKPAFCNAGGTIQGGFLAAMLDDALSPTVLIVSDAALYAATIDLHVHFLAPAWPGILIAEARIVQLGKSIGFLEARLAGADGGVAAKATASVRLIPAAKALA